jgi:hypothetical protein
MTNLSEDKRIIINNQPLDYTLRISRRAKRLRLAIYNDGRLVVTRPYRLSSVFVDHFIRAKADWILAQVGNSQKFPRPLTTAGRREDYLQKKEAARRLVYSRLEYFNQFYNYNYRAVSIRNQATRWGSCSKKGNLNFNYRLVDLVPRVADYIIVHELCHLKEFNHSARFWNLVAATLPDYKDLRKQIRGHLA